MQYFSIFNFVLSKITQTILKKSRLIFCVEFMREILNTFLKMKYKNIFTKK